MKKRILILFLITTFLFDHLYANYKIAVIPKGSVGQFWEEVGIGAKKAGDEFGVEVIFRGPRVEDDGDSQLKLMRFFINQKIDAIVLAPSNKEKLMLGAKEASAKGVKVIVIDSALSGDYHESFIATDNYEAGRKAGEELAKIVGKGKVALLRNRKGNSSTDLREEGFSDVMKEKKIEIAADEYVGAVYGNILKVSAEVIAKNPNIKGYFAPYEMATIGLVKSLEKANLNGKVAVMGFDYSEAIQKGIDNGDISGAIIQQPDMMGYLGVKAALDALNGEKIEKKIVVDVKYLSK